MARQPRKPTTRTILRKWLKKRWKVFLAFLLIASATVAVSTRLFDFSLTTNLVILLVEVFVGTLGVLSDIKSVFGEDDALPAETKIEAEQVQVISGEGARGVQVKDGDYYEGGQHTHVHTTPPQKPTPQTTPIPSAGAPLYIPRGAVEDKLRAALRNHSTNALVGASGMGGVGKTELAKQLARELEAEREKSTLWVDLPGKSLDQVQTDMAIALGVDLPPDASKETRKQLLDAALAAQERTVFLDDVRLEFVDDLPFCLPPSPPCAALVTSRVTQLGLLPGAMHDLDVMDAAQSRALLRSFDGLPALLDAEPGADAGLIQACCFHPLALALAAARLLEKQHFWRKPVAGLTAALQHRLDELQRSGLSGKDASLRANLDQSYQALNAEEQRCFRALAVFAPGGFGLAGAAAVWQLGEPTAEKMILRLAGLSLLRPVTGRPGRWRLHDLLRDYAGEQLRDCGEEAAASQRLAEYLIALFEEHYTDDLSNAPEVAWEQDNLTTAAGRALRAGDGPRLARLATMPYNWLTLWSQWSDWESWLQAALRLGAGEKTLTARVHEHLGDVQYQRNQYAAALDSYAAALALFKEVSYRQGEANTLRATGDVQRMHSQYAAALDNYAAALALFKEVGDRQGEANTLFSTGIVQYKRNQYAAALESYDCAMKLYHEMGSRLGEANTHRATGDVQRICDQYDAALDSYAGALALYQEVGDQQGEANTLAGTGRVRLAQGDPAEADRLLAQAVVLFTAIGDRYSIAASTGNYGWTLYNLGRKSAARLYLLRAAGLFDEIGMHENAERYRKAAAAQD